MSKRFALLACAALAASFMAGCTGSDDQYVDKTPPPSADAQPSAVDPSTRNLIGGETPGGPGGGGGGGADAGMAKPVERPPGM